jgi:hypothetical protein
MDSFGGWTFAISQKWFGHRAEKKTLLYIVGVAPRDLPSLPYSMQEAECVIARSRNRQQIREVTKSEREHTPLKLAEWLVKLTRDAKPGHSLGQRTENQDTAWVAMEP